MDNIAATPLNALTAPSTHTARTAADTSGDTGSFEEALGSELAAIKPAAKKACPDLLAADEAAADSDKTGAADGTQVLQTLLDAANVIPTVALPVPAVPAEHIKAAKDHDAAPPRIFGAKDVRPAMPARAGEIRADAVVEHAGEAEMRNVTAVNVAATTVSEETSTTAANTSAPVDAPGPTVRAASSAHSPASEAVAAVQKTHVPAPKAAPEAAPAVRSSERQDNRDGMPARPLDEIVTRPEVRQERTHTEPFVTASAEKAASTEAQTSVNNVASSLDALSSAALVSKWSPGPQSNTMTPAHTPTSARIDTPFGTQGWGDAFSQKIVWLVDRQQQSAELHVNPPHLGPVEVVLNLSDDGARIAFCSPHAPVREAIEASLTDLRNALSERGLSLGQALVSADPGSAREQLRDENAQAAQRSSVDVAGRDAVTEIQTVRPLRRGLVDIFA